SRLASRVSTLVVSSREGRPSFAVGRTKVATAKPLRLRRSEDFRACYEKGHMHRGSLVVVHVLPNSLPVTRIGYSVSKRLGKAVQRNRVRRRLQAIMREYDL